VLLGLKVANLCLLEHHHQSLAHHHLKQNISKQKKGGRLTAFFCD
jgi:hypothetical protein